MNPINPPHDSSSFMMVDDENSPHSSGRPGFPFTNFHASPNLLVRPLPLPLVTSPFPSPTHLRVVSISDTHGWCGDIPNGDILIHAGDFTDKGEVEWIFRFDSWLASLPHKYKIVIAGNHDVTLHPEYYQRSWKRFGHPKPYDCLMARRALKSCIYLQDSLVNIEGLRIYGTPWQPELWDWAFNLPRGAELRKAWDRIPSNLDILITHSPPYGHGDWIIDTEAGNRKKLTGCIDLLQTVQQRVRPQFHVFGHIHEAYGVTTDGFTTFINAAKCMPYNNRAERPPIVFDILRPQHRPRNAVPYMPMNAWANARNHGSNFSGSDSMLIDDENSPQQRRIMPGSGGPSSIDPLSSPTADHPIHQLHLQRSSLFIACHESKVRDGLTDRVCER